MAPAAVAKAVGIDASRAKTIHERPAVIQELDWRLDTGGVSGKADSVGSIRFRFYNGELFRMIVDYDFIQVRGLTAEDVIDAISARYGIASRPEANVAVSSSSGYDSAEKVLARWEDSQYVYDLFRPSYRSTFILVLQSKPLDLLASAAILEAERLDKLEAPTREIERQRKQDSIDDAAEEKQRSINKPKFRP